MTERSLDELLQDEQDAIVVAVQARMRGDETMAEVAAQRQLRERDLSGQVLGFWLTAIRSDLELGFSETMRQNLEWLVSLRSGHRLPFGDELVGRMFRDISEEIEARLDSDDQRARYASYRDEVLQAIAETFPG